MDRSRSERPYDAKHGKNLHVTDAQRPFYWIIFKLWRGEEFLEIKVILRFKYFQKSVYLFVLTPYYKELSHNAISWPDLDVQPLIMAKTSQILSSLDRWLYF